ncbi:MAG: MBL fold metallo-hydrolase [Planctomycetaceae bacterium]|nr:MBL fold metallo-hydrolase [Planctomycetaceae bacterium]
MELKQYYLGCLAHASYMIADKRTGVAAVVDPQRDIEQYLADAQKNGWQIRYVFLTHFHADFLAGHIELRNRTGAHIYLGEHAQAEYNFTAVRDGDVVEFGDVRLQIMATPGHTPEGISLLVYDLPASDRDPMAVLTGDTLFIGDVGRPDLLASIGVTADELASQLYDSVHKLMDLPDATLVYPAHGAGSLCGKNLSNQTVSTIGEQKKYNYALQPMSRQEFMDLVRADQPDAPDYFVYDAILNRKERPGLDETMRTTVKALTVEEVLQHQQRGSQLLDVRDGIDFEGGHLKGSINIPLDGKYAIWCGSLLRHDRPIVIIAETDGEEEAVMRLGRIGYDNVAGYLDGGMHVLESLPELVESTDRITAVALHSGLQQTEPPVVLDVRSPGERETHGIVGGSLSIPLNHLEERLADLPTDKPLVVHCAGGYRSAIACSLLQKHGIKCTDLVGGFQAWKSSQLPVVELATV